MVRSGPITEGAPEARADGRAASGGGGVDCGERGGSGTADSGFLLPKFESMVPRSPKASTSVSAGALKAAAKQIASERDSGSPVSMMMYTSDGVLYAKGDGSPVPVGRYEGRAFDPVHVSPKYVTKALSRANGSVQLNLGTPLQPIVINREDGEQHLIMPMRV